MYVFNYNYIRSMIRQYATILQNPCNRTSTSTFLYRPKLNMFLQTLAIDNLRVSSSIHDTSASIEVKASFRSLVISSAYKTKLAVVI